MVAKAGQIWGIKILESNESQTDKLILFKLFSRMEHFLIVSREEKRLRIHAKDCCCEGERSQQYHWARETNPEFGKPRSRNLTGRETQRRDIQGYSPFKTFARFLCCSKLQTKKLINNNNNNNNHRIFQIHMVKIRQILYAMIYQKERPQ